MSQYSMKCPVCGADNDVSLGVVICSQCGGFLRDHTQVQKQLARSQMRYGAALGFVSLSEHPVYQFVRPVITTCSLSLDMALMCGGIPQGAKVEIMGTESSGKSTLALQIIAEWQRRNASCAYVDLEGTLDDDYARSLGVDIAKLHVTRPTSGTQAIEQIGANCEYFDLIVIDTVACLNSSNFIDKVQEVDKKSGEVEEIQDFSGVARQLAVLQGKWNGKFNRLGTTILMLNQARDNIVQGGGSYGIRAPGGRVMKHFATQRIELKRIGGKSGQLVDGSEQIGFMVEAKIIKNKYGHEGNKALMKFVWGRGFDKRLEYFDLAIEFGLIVRAGAWYKDTDGKTLGQGAERTLEYLEANPAVFDVMKKQIEDKIRGDAVKVKGGVEEDDNE